MGDGGNPMSEWVIALWCIGVGLFGAGSSTPSPAAIVVGQVRHAIAAPDTRSDCASGDVCDEDAEDEDVEDEDVEDEDACDGCDPDDEDDDDDDRE